MPLKKDTETWTRYRLQRQRQRPTIRKTSSSSTLIPPELVEDVWFNALEDSEEIAINTTAFADYVTEYWVEGNNRQQWNHFDNEGPRTNNHLEGWHGKLKKHLNHAHPNIFVLIELFFLFQT